MEFKMRKSIIIPAVLFTAAGIASPLLMGLVAENQFTTQLEQMSAEQTAGKASISDVQFNRGYAQSEASFVMTIEDPSTDLPAVSILIESDLQHAPISISEFGLSALEINSQDRFSLIQGPEDFIAFINDNMQGYFLTGYSRANVLGNFDSVLSSPALDFSSEAGDFNILMDSMVINTSGKLDGSVTDFDVKLPSTTIKGTEFSVNVASVTAIGDRYTDTSGVELGKTLMEVAQVSVVSAMGGAEIKNITLSAVSDLVGDKIDTNVHYNVESIVAPLPVSSASYHVDFNGLSVASAQLVQDLQKHLNEMEANPESADQFFNQLISATLQPGLQINQELKANAFGGDWVADLDVEYTGIEGVELAAMKDPKVAVQGIAATLVITADNAALLRTPLAPMLDGLLQQGFITLDNTNLTTAAYLNAGKLTINEVEMPVDSIIDAILLKLAQSQQEEVAVN